ncbi:MAG: DUF1704 domain-containing protein [Bdellovibrionales bacterium]|nr:DUF1704 domain-containing protein [Bdellovibrionales bacterium]
MDNKRREKLKTINEKVFELASTIKLLSNVAWPIETQNEFLNHYSTGKAKLPEVAYQKINYDLEKNELLKLKQSFTADEPTEVYTIKNIESLLDAIELNHAIGTNSFTELSKKIFGVPGDTLPNSDVSIITAAEQIINLADEFYHPYVNPQLDSFQAEDIKNYMEKRIHAIFKDEAPQIEITDTLAAKATATAKIIRLRKGPHFSHFDFKQLFYHEIMTHALTSLNGEAQPLLRSMGRGTLRTLRTQEGLATFSEVVTGAMDIHRLKRLALRTVAIDMALKGANFIETFEYFVSKNISLNESFSSTQRIFRGGFPDKNIVFTKDSIYLDGLMNVHTLFRWAMKHNRIELTHLLFCGRVALEDLHLLESSYAEGLIIAPKFLPGWYAKIEILAGSLMFSLLANLIKINKDYD